MEVGISEFYSKPQVFDILRVRVTLDWIVIGKDRDSYQIGYVA